MAIRLPFSRNLLDSLPSLVKMVRPPDVQAGSPQPVQFHPVIDLNSFQSQDFWMNQAPNASALSALARGAPAQVGVRLSANPLPSLKTQAFDRFVTGAPSTGLSPDYASTITKPPADFRTAEITANDDGVVEIVAKDAAAIANAIPPGTFNLPVLGPVDKRIVYVAAAFAALWAYRRF